MPESGEKAIFIGGQHNIIFAADTADKSRKGHISSVLDLDLEVITIPTKNGTPPPHRVLYDGVCGPAELVF